MNQVLMCHPTHFDVVYDINPWMTGNKHLVNRKRAIEQWIGLYTTICKYTSIQLVEPNQSCPDMVFTANAGFHFGKKNVILSNFKYKERKPEEQLFNRWFNSNNYTVHTVKNSFEGQGDLLKDAKGNLWLGTGFRTDRVVLEELEHIFDSSVRPLKLVDPRWYHLDTCFCPLPNGELMWYPKAFDDSSQKIIRQQFTITLDVSEEDALLFACNSVYLLNNVFTPVCSHEIHIMLEKFGYHHMMVDLDEFLKAGGAAKCLVMDIDELY